MEKKTRKSVPRPNSGRRAADGATDLVKVGVRLSAEQHEWVKANGNDGLRQFIQARIDAEREARPLFVVELTNGNWHTVTRSETEANAALDEWNSHHPGGARLFTAYAIEDKQGSNAEAGRIKEKLSSVDYGSMTNNQKRYWAKRCERYGIPVPDELKD